MPASRPRPNTAAKAARPADRSPRPMNLETASAPEKEKLSITLDTSIVEDIRKLFGAKALSTSINELLHEALRQHRLGLLVAWLEEEAGPPTDDDYKQVFAQWFQDP